MRLLIISPTAVATGNFTTICRLQKHLSSSGHNVMIISPQDLIIGHDKCPRKALDKFVEVNSIDGVLLLHAYKSGLVLTSDDDDCQEIRSNFKYGVIFGGTDLNEDVRDPTKLSVMKKVIEKSTFCVAFTESLSSIARTLSPECCVLVQPQCLDHELFSSDVTTSHTSLGSEINNNKGEATPIVPAIFVLPASIRPVKDPCFLVELFRLKTHKLFQNYDARLLIIGPVSDQEYFQRFCELLGVDDNYTIDNPCNDLNSWINDSKGSSVRYLKPLPITQLHSYFRSNTFRALVNTSLSEGMSSVILEAMACRLPVLARSIAGNEAVIDHSKTGFLFESADDFAACALTLLDNRCLRENITSAAHTYVSKFHHPDAEQKFYDNLVKEKFL